MTDSELIKELEDLHQRLVLNYNDDIPFEQLEEDRLAVNNAIDLINRLQAEVNHLDNESDALLADIDFRDKENKKLQAENERLEVECDKQYKIAEATIRAEIADGGTSCHWCEDTIRGVAKAEAYKEFAELLCKIWQRYEDENISGIYVPKWVMRVYEELVGEQPILNDVKCKDCEYLEFELPYAVCSKTYKGIVAPDDSCGKGKLKELVGEDNANSI